MPNWCQNKINIAFKDDAQKEAFKASLHKNTSQHRAVEMSVKIIVALTSGAYGQDATQKTVDALNLSNHVENVAYSVFQTADSELTRQGNAALMLVAMLASGDYIKLTEDTTRYIEELYQKSGGDKLTLSQLTFGQRERVVQICQALANDFHNQFDELASPERFTQSDEPYFDALSYNHLHLALQLTGINEGLFKAVPHPRDRLTTLTALHDHAQCYGTKFRICEKASDVISFDEDNNTCEIKLLSANSPCIPVIKSLAQTLQLNLVYTYADFNGAYAGFLTFENGELKDQQGDCFDNDESAPVTLPDYIKQSF